jgi:hypothetical protein
MDVCPMLAFLIPGVGEEELGGELIDVSLVRFSQESKGATFSDGRSFEQLIGDNAGTWPNNNLLAFLEALSAWVRDMDGYYLNRGLPVPNRPQWSTFAHMLMAATMYE